MKSAPATIDQFLATINDPHRSALQRLREQIQRIVPTAEEGISYGMAAFRWNGKPIAGFSAGAGHCAFHPMSGSVVSQFPDELSGFETSKGTVRFQPEKPIPLALLRRLIQARIAELPAPKPKPKPTTATTTGKKKATASRGTTVRTSKVDGRKRSPSTRRKPAKS